MDYTEIVILLDRSGSMAHGKDDHIGGLRSFVTEQQKMTATSGDAKMTLVQFDSQDPFELTIDGLDIRDVNPAKIDLVPRGMTPLLDALGKTMAHVDKRVESAKEKPSQVVVMVITDGHENASTEWTKEGVKSRVTELEGKGWHFLYLGAGIDAFDDASSMGVGAATTLNTQSSGAGLRSAYAATSQKLMSNRLKSFRGEVIVKEDYTYTSAEREDAMKEAKKP